jgi:hypothetical protein
LNLASCHVSCETKFSLSEHYGVSLSFLRPQQEYSLGKPIEMHSPGMIHV